MIGGMATSYAERAAHFRALHDAPGTFVIPNPWDAGTARILEALGFQALTTTSAGLAFSLGRRDGEGLVSRDEVLAHIRGIARATDLPLAADLENGFGDDPHTVAETIRLAAEAGAVGGSIEDSTGDPERPIYDRTHSVERIAAAVEAARSLSSPFVLVARAENFLHGLPDLDDTVSRLQAFAAAGADVLYAPGLPDLDAIRSVCAAVTPRPVNVLASGKFTVAELAAAGAKRISVGSALCRVGLGAFLRAAREIRERGSFSFNDDAAPFEDLNRYMEGRQG
jgi:2-methylisocitrate lyase-like PEP mutase family enzyme